jgi:hypothetical protein
MNKSKKTTLLAASLGLFMGLAVAPAYGQVWGVKVKVPFKFMVASQTLPEGEYLLSSVRDEVLVQDSEGKRVATVMTNAVGGRKVGKTGEVVFDCYTDVCFLSQLWTPGQDSGRELLKSHAETEMAKRETGKYFSLLGSEPRK